MSKVKEPASKNSAPDSGGSLEDKNLTQIRDILFGQQVREIDRRFAALEERLVDNIETIKEDTLQRFRDMESSFKKDVSLLVEQLQTEQSERSGAVIALGEELRERIGALEGKAGQIVEELATAENTLRQKMADEVTRLRDQFQTGQQEQMAALDRQAKTLETNKVDRSAISDILRELASRLDGESRKT